MRFFKYMFIGFIFVAITLIADNRAFAQETGVSSRQIDEIIVTSRKTEENIQDVPNCCLCSR